MTSKVETEYNNCIFALTLAQKGADEGFVNAEMYKALDALVAAAHAEGVAEGAAGEREKIRRMQLCGRRVQVSQFPDDERRNLRIETDVDGVAYTLVPVSVLAPTKERPYAERLRDCVNDIINGEDIDPTPD